MSATTTGAALRLVDLILRFGKVKRATFHQDGVTPESDAEHSLMLAILAPALAEVWMREGRIPYVNLGKLAMYATIHDLPEVYAGDTDTTVALTHGQKDAKDKREGAARRKIFADFAHALPLVTDLMRDYEDQKDVESRLVRYLDKVLPKITNILNGGAGLAVAGIPLVVVKEQHAAQAATLRAEYPEFPALADLFEDCARMCERTYVL